MQCSSQNNTEVNRNSSNEEIMSYNTSSSSKLSSNSSSSSKLSNSSSSSSSSSSTLRSFSRTSSNTNKTKSMIEPYLNSFNFYGNFSNKSDSFISYDGFYTLIKDLHLKKMNKASKNFNNITVKCHSRNEIESWFNKKKQGLTKQEFIEICPTLLIQVASRVCRYVNTKTSINRSSLQIWLCSFGAVIVISLVGLLVVWLIPIMPKSYYNSISQLLIAIAVGSLTGDALLHLIPHALMDNGGKGHSHNNTNKVVWKSLIALIGIHIFFLTERITILYQNLQSKKKSKKHLSVENFYSEVSAGDKFDDSEKIPVKNSENKALSTGKLHWASKSRKYSGSSKELAHASSHIGIDGEANVSSHLCNRPKSKPHVNSDCPDSMNYELCNTINPYSMNPESNSNNTELRLPINGEVKINNNLPQHDENKNSSSLFDRQGVSNNIVSTGPNDNNNWSNKEDHKLLQPLNPTESNLNNIEVKISGTKHLDKAEKVEIGAGGATVKSSLAHPFKNKPHGHHHGHSHDLSSVKAIAYTVIAGDGLHNFCDGIAIGAAFANDLSGGFSTAIAVLCHELPHELGDFVVLLHAGMSLRTALFYNLMSSIFCAIGMIIGVQLGKLQAFSSWIFMLTAGMFLYIALVDMMPELSTRRLKGKKLFHRPSVLFLWQNIGLIIGSVIMLMIALYEEHMF